MNKIGFLINGLGPSQLSYGLIKSGNKFVENGYNDLVLFYYNLEPEILQPKFAIMNLSEAYSYNGILVATDANSASRILEYPGASKKVFYMWDLEWVHMPQKRYEDLVGIYKNTNLPLIVRSKRHFDMVSKFWQTPIGVVENANVKDIYNVITGNKNEK